MSESVKHQTGITGVVAWKTDTEAGIDCAGFTWTGSMEVFEREWKYE